jgi:hypothetical protein
MSQNKTSCPLSIAFFVLWMIPAFLGLPALLIALFFGRDVPRRPAVASLAVSFMLSGAVYSILLLASKFNLDKLKPSASLCAGQASLVAGTDMMCVPSPFYIMPDIQVNSGLSIP